MVLHNGFLKGLGAAACGALLLASCAQATSDTKKPGPVDPFASAGSTLDTWTINPGYGNTYDKANFKLAYVAHGTGKALAIQYGASADYGITEVYAEPLNAGDVSGYDLIRFDVKTNYEMSFQSVLRGSNGTSDPQAWQAKDTEWYQGGTNGDYVTHTLTIADFNKVWEGAGTTLTSATDYFAATAAASNPAVFNQINLLIAKNPGGTMGDTTNMRITAYIDNIRLVDTAATSPKADKVLFDFDN